MSEMGGGVFSQKSISRLALVWFPCLFLSTVVLAQSWTRSDIGTVGISGSASVLSGTYSISGAGAGLDGTTDSFDYVYVPVTGNTELIARVLSQTNTGNYALAGLMIRDGLTAGASHATVAVSPGDGLNFFYRGNVGQSTTKMLGTSGTAPCWLRLVSSGSTFAGYQSSDGQNWNLVGNVTFGISGTYYIGFAVSSHSMGILSTEAYDHVSLLTNVPQRNNNMVLWLRGDAGVITGSSGNNVTQWTDQSGNAANATQTSSTSQPVLTISAINGLSALTFDGSNDFLQFNSGFANFTQGMTFFVVAKPTNTASGARFIDFGNGGTSDNINLGRNGTSQDFRFRAVNGTTASYLTASGALVQNQYQLLEAVHNGGSSGNTMAYLYGNTSLLISGSVFVINNLTRNYNYMGKSNSSSDGYYGGQIAEMLLYNRALSTAERQGVEAYLYAKYAMGVMPALSTPISSIPSATYSTGQTVTLTGPAGALIYYTTDGSTPTTSSMLYNGPITVNSTQTIKWIAVQYGFTTSNVGSVSVTIDPNTAAVSRSGMVTWLRGDAGVVSSGGSVSQWNDQSGNGMNAISGTVSNQPILSTNEINSQPALVFDGTNDYMQLGSGFADFTQGMTAFLVVKPTTTGSFARFFDLGNGSGGSNDICLGRNATMQDSRFSVYNGSSSSVMNGSNGLIQNQYQVVEALHNGGTSGTTLATLFTNGVQTGTGSLNVINNVVRSANYIGKDNFGNKLYGGGMAELIIYNRALSTIERQAVEAYLYARYAVGVGPTLTTPTSNLPTATYTGNQTILLNSPESAAIYYTTDGSTPTTGSTVYTGSITVNSTQTIKWIAVKNGYSNSPVGSVTITIDPNSSGVSRSGLMTWLRSDVGIVTSGSSVSQWIDQSGNGMSASGTSNMPTFTSSAVNGLPEIAFNGSNQYLKFGSGFTDFTQGMTIFVVAKPTTTGSYARFFDFGGGQASNNIGFERSAATPNLLFSIYSGSTASSLTASSALAQNQYQVLEAVHNGGTSGSGTASIYKSGTLLLSGTLNVIANVTRTSNYMGRSNWSSDAYYGGGIAELIIYNRALSTTERQGVEAYLYSKYAVGVGPTLTTPTTGAQTATYAGSQVVSLISPEGATIYYTTDGSTPTTGSTIYTGPITVNSTQTIKWIAVKNGYTNSGIGSVTITIDPNSSGVSRSGMITWLRGDVGVVTSGGSVSQWTDQSGSGMSALQTTGSYQPTFTSSAINGLPEITFSGTKQYLQFGSGFSDFTQGMTVFVVAKPTTSGSAARFF